ncbi:MAG: molybdenum cofactor guanylyltransferase [Natronomonas sp.]
MTAGNAGDDSRPNRAGIILAGGRSTRFHDADKAFAELAGEPMVRRVATRLATVTHELVVNCRADQRAAMEETMADSPHPVKLAIDEEPDRGPMAGIATSLRTTTADLAAVVACDMPFVEPFFVEYLFELVDDGSVDAAVPRLSDGWYQPTQAVYRNDPMLAACERALERGDGRILDALSALTYEIVEESTIERRTDLETFENVNTREEFEAAARRIAERDGEDG